MPDQVVPPTATKAEHDERIHHLLQALFLGRPDQWDTTCLEALHAEMGRREGYGCFYIATTATKGTSQ